jgi:hypothetical protein
MRTFFFIVMSGLMDVLTLFRLLITSVLRVIGRGRPWSLRNKPQALQSTAPVSSRRHNGVVDVVQFWHTGCGASRPLLAMVAILTCAEEQEMAGDGRLGDGVGGISKKRLI